MVSLMSFFDANPRAELEDACELWYAFSASGATVLGQSRGPLSTYEEWLSLDRVKRELRERSALLPRQSVEIELDPMKEHVLCVVGRLTAGGALDDSAVWLFDRACTFLVQQRRRGARAYVCAGAGVLSFSFSHGLNALF